VSIDARLRRAEGRVPPVAPDRQAVRAALARLSVAELEALESATEARATGRPLTKAEQAALAAWERAAST
jgi:hypothetical protein